MKTKKMTRLTIIMILISFIFTTVISVSSLNKVINDNAEDVTTILAARIYDTINSELSNPIMVARTMANDSFLIRLLQQESSVSEEEMLAELTEYLDMIKNELGYNTAFVVSDSSKKYYTYEGLNKIISPEDGGHDVWYSIFLDGGKNYDFDVDTDEVNADSWTIFVNCRIEDENGNLLGVCGVGVVMTDIQEILQGFEQQYDVKVNLVNRDGLVQVDTNSVNIENAVLEEVLANSENHEGYVYTRNENGGYVVTRYLEDFGWYLIIRNDGTDAGRIFSGMIIKHIMAFVVILVLLLISVRILLDREKKKLENSAITDSLTGLANRTYFKYNIEENPAFAMKLYKTLAIFDVDEFKTINDTMGHLKGDEILKAVAELVKEVVKDKGQIIRWGGDEFLILFKGDESESYQICEELRRTVEDNTDVTISVGICRLENDIESCFHKADELLYKAKEKGKNKVV